jgi:hypothetical protein
MKNGSSNPINILVITVVMSSDGAGAVHSARQGCYRL